MTSPYAARRNACLSNVAARENVSISGERLSKFQGLFSKFSSFLYFIAGESQRWCRLRGIVWQGHGGFMGARDAQLVGFDKHQ